MIVTITNESANSFNLSFHPPLLGTNFTNTYNTTLFEFDKDLNSLASLISVLEILLNLIHTIMQSPLSRTIVRF